MTPHAHQYQSMQRPGPGVGRRSSLKKLIFHLEGWTVLFVDINLVFEDWEFWVNPLLSFQGFSPPRADHALTASDGPAAAPGFDKRSLKLFLTFTGKRIK